MLWQSPAKINLHLRVGEVRPDGFHPLSSWMVTVGLFDKLSFEFDRSRSSGLLLICDDPAVPRDESNLIVKAIRLWLSATGRTQSVQRILDIDRLKVFLSKQIPLGGGLGGGSSNAATTLLALNAIIGESRHEVLDETCLRENAARLGSDVPFFFDAPSALSSGRGEKIVRVASPKPKAVMLFFPPFGISTAEVYRVLDELRPHAPEDALDPIDVEEWKMLSAAALLPRLRNDLELVAFHLQPKLGELREMLERKLERPVRMSGSGSTLFTLYDTEAEAHLETLGRLEQIEGVESRVCSLGSARIEQIGS